MLNKVLIIITVFGYLKSVDACAGGGFGGGGGIITNPSLQMKFHPPTSWTFPSPSAETDLTYFPGQSMSQSEAQLRANGDMNSAVLAGLQALQLPTTGVTIIPSYTPQQVNDCGKTATAETMTGAQIGFQEGGAITKLITVAQTVTPEKCAAHDFAPPAGEQLISMELIAQASIKIDGVTMSEYQANLFAAKVSQFLMLNAKVDFTEEIIAS